MIDCQELKDRDRIAVPGRIALSPIEDSFGSFEDLTSFFTMDVTSPKMLTPLQSSSAMFSAGEFLEKCHCNLRALHVLYYYCVCVQF